MLRTQWSGGEELATVTGCGLGVEVRELLKERVPRRLLGSLCCEPSF